jgi:hypothetical protein
MTTDPSQKPPFLPVLGYVLGLMGVLAFVVFLVIALTRLLR